VSPLNTILLTFSQAMKMEISPKHGATSQSAAGSGTAGRTTRVTLDAERTTERAEEVVSTVRTTKMMVSPLAVRNTTACILFLHVII
jgi:FAD/FMN-containing dehydrogenase